MCVCVRSSVQPQKLPIATKWIIIYRICHFVCPQHEFILDRQNTCINNIDTDFQGKHLSAGKHSVIQKNELRDWFRYYTQTVKT